MSSIEKALQNYYKISSSLQLNDYLRTNFQDLDFDELQSQLKFSRYTLEQFITSFIKAQQEERVTLETQEKEDLFLYIACLLKLELFTFAETVEFFIPRTLQRFAPQTLRQSFYNFKKNKKMSQLQVYLNYNFVDLEELFQTNPDEEKLEFEAFFDKWVQYIQGDESVLQLLCPEVFKILSGEIEVQIPTAIEELNEEAKVTKNMRIYEMEQHINTILERRVLNSKSFDSVTGKLRDRREPRLNLPFNTGMHEPSQKVAPNTESEQHDHQQEHQRENTHFSLPSHHPLEIGPRQGEYDLESPFRANLNVPAGFGVTAVPTIPSLSDYSAEMSAQGMYGNGRMSAVSGFNQSFEAALGSNSQYFESSTNEIAEIFNEANEMQIPNPPPINLEAFTHSANYSTVADIESLSLLNNSTLSNNSLLQNDFRSVINENTQMQRQEESDAQQNLVHALGGMEEVSMCLMQLGIHERSESKQ